MTNLIARDELQQLIHKGAAIVVDALPRSYYDRDHLPGAINLVESDVDALASELLPVCKIVVCRRGTPVLSAECA